MIGTLIETNDRIIAALESYDAVRFLFISEYSSVSLTSYPCFSSPNLPYPSKTSKMSRTTSLQSRSKTPSWASYKRSSAPLFNGRLDDRAGRRELRGIMTPTSLAVAALKGVYILTCRI